MKKFLAIAASLLCLVTFQARAQNYLLDDVGGRLLDNSGGFLLAQGTTDTVITVPVGGGIHSVIQVATWAQGPDAVTVTLYADVLPDKNVKLIAHAVEGTKTIQTVWLYLNGVIVATCPGATCNYVLPNASMHAGQNKILTAYQPVGAPARGTAFDLSKP